ncbi:peptidase domain-containing ABC transporter [Kutzneria kofuensis]|uniref:ABC-type bacteriocin/lantibiotic exporter with double-glycine peptidase domain n=1 Tax=Kutzneria kofuensis TaxID=103725 RepID=A0A7W9KPT4_9PSEU|nr:peptidase domain-containing ABC transporter [Kutzneria kofuensis]MBB5896504.1 ABC-type bacteriocin/lantibiotic exporter with double-glycine peptidase domain [Kutzneria kofuensis]
MSTMRDGERAVPNSANPPAPVFREQAMAARGAARELGAAVSPGFARPARTNSDDSEGAADRPRRSWLRAGWDALRARRVPVRIQSQVSDCGPTCLAMVFALHGVEVPIRELREAAGTGRDGVSARRLLDAARDHGFRGRGVRTTLDGLRDLPAGAILFWNFNHFVVLERVAGRHIHLVDPQYGRRRMTLDAVGEAFTGVALLLSPPLPTTGEKPSIFGLPFLAKLVHRRRARRPEGSWRYARYFLPGDRRWIPFVLCSLLLLGFNLATPLVTKAVADHATGGRTGGTALFLLGVALLAVLYFLLQFARSVAFAAIQTRVDEEVTTGVLHRLLALPYGFFATRAPGDLMQRVRTSTAVRQILSATAFTSMFDGLLVLFYMALLLLADPLLAGLAIALALAQVAVLVLSWRRQEYASVDALEARSRADAELVELLEGLSTLKAAGLEDVAARRWSHTLADELNARTRSRRLLAVSSVLSSALQIAAPLLVLVVGSVRVDEGLLSTGDVLGFSVLAMGLLVPLANLVQTGLQLSGLGASFARLGDIMEAVPERAARDGAAAPTDPDPGGALSFENVSFAYPGSEPVLDEVSFTVPAGSFTVILGASGSGKSTCALLAAGLYPATSGRVRALGRDLARTDTVAYRRSIAFVNQDSRLFAGSIRDNITFGSTDTDIEAIKTAARLAEIHQDIRTLPLKYQTVLGSGGAGLSGGQRQRVALARALMRRPEILILDEATSALDPALERRIFRSLVELGTTLVVIAHRLTAVEEADQIVVLDQGRVVQRGHHRDLVAQDGPYRSLTQRDVARSDA